MKLSTFLSSESIIIIHIYTLRCALISNSHYRMRVILGKHLFRIPLGLVTALISSVGTGGVEMYGSWNGSD